MCLPLALECDSSSDNRLHGSALLKFALWSYYVNLVGIWSSFLKLDMLHFSLLRSNIIRPHCCIFALLSLYPTWHSWTIHCHRNRPACSIGIPTGMLLKFSLSRKLSAVFSVWILASLQNKYPCTAKFSLTILNQTDSPSACQ